MLCLVRYGIELCFLIPRLRLVADIIPSCKFFPAWSLQVSLAFLVLLGHVTFCLEACLAGGWCVVFILPHVWHYQPNTLPPGHNCMFVQCSTCCGISSAFVPVQLGFSFIRSLHHQPRTTLPLVITLHPFSVWLIVGSCPLLHPHGQGSHLYHHLVINPGPPCPLTIAVCLFSVQLVMGSHLLSCLRG